MYCDNTVCWVLFGIPLRYLGQSPAIAPTGQAFSSWDDGWDQIHEKSNFRPSWRCWIINIRNKDAEVTGNWKHLIRVRTLRAEETDTCCCCRLFLCHISKSVVTPGEETGTRLENFSATQIHHTLKPQASSWQKEIKQLLRGWALFSACGGFTGTEDVPGFWLSQKFDTPAVSWGNLCS